MGEFLDGFGEGGVGWGGGGGRGEEVRGQEVQAEGEVWGGEDGEGFDEDVGDGFVAGEVRVELVSVAGGGEWFVSEGSRREGFGTRGCGRKMEVGGSDRANNLTSGARD